MSVVWKQYQVTLQVEGPFGASIPRTEEEVRNMLEHRMPRVAPPDAVPIDQLADQVAQEVGADEEEFVPGWLTFKRDKKRGLYYEGRCVRGHIKDCALQVQGFFPQVKNFRAKLVNRLYVVTDRIVLDRQEPDGYETRYIQVMTRQGPRSSIKYVDYVCDPMLVFGLKLMDDGVIGREHLEAVFEYGSLHGLGAERSQGWGRYIYEIAEVERSQ